MDAESDVVDPLFVTKRPKGRLIIYRLFCVSLFIGIVSIWIYRFSHLLLSSSSSLLYPNTHNNDDDIEEEGEEYYGIKSSWAIILLWIGMFGVEVWFGLYWVLTQAARWNPLFRQPFKDTLSQRYERRLPKVDIFVCTADPEREPAMMVMNTVLSAMAYDYPKEKLSVYLSDDAASQITFYAFFEASIFAKHWLPYCKTFNIQHPSPSAYFSSANIPHDDHAQHQHFLLIKKMYEEMEGQINEAAKSGEVPQDVLSKHKGFSEWDSSYSSRRDHDTILQILLHRKDPNNSKDANGFALPTLVYLAREKRPQHPHQFKAGAMNALLRVSSKISNGKIILNVDCDMYSNNLVSLREALCFFMDEHKGHEIAYVQCPQTFVGVTKNDLYGSELRVIYELEFHGVDGYGGPLYIGTGCFHRRDVLCGRKFSDQHKNLLIDEWSSNEKDDLSMTEVSLLQLEQESKPLASSTYEQNTLWGTEMGLVYGCAVEDVITGLSIQSKGWKSVYYKPSRKAFLGVAPSTLPETLVQHKRWSEGQFQILLSKYSPAWFAYGKISLGLQMAYMSYNLWAPNSLPTLFYSTIPSLCLLKGIPLFPKVSSPWFIPFVYVTFGETIYGIYEFLSCGGTIKGWWNEQRICVYKRSSSYLFSFIDNMFNLLGFPSNSGFTITAKVADDEVSERFKKEIMEFGTSSPMFTVLATLALLNLCCFLGAIIFKGIGIERMVLQVILCGVLVIINIPIYQALFFRKDKGRLPSSVAIKSTALALAACVLFIAIY